MFSISNLIIMSLAFQGRGRRVGFDGGRDKWQFFFFAVYD